MLFLPVGAAVDPDRKANALLQAGADPLAEDEGGRTALDAVVADLCTETEEPGSCVRSYSAGLG
jgi:hypothetical protein